MLELLPEDVIAKECKLVALIHLGEVDAAYKYAKSKAMTDAKYPGASMEKAYCFYRSGQLGKALDCVTEGEKVEGDVSEGTMELKGQLLYRLGRMEESKAVYEDLLSKAKQKRKAKVKSDLLGNIIAAYLAADKAHEVGSVLNSFSSRNLQETPELAYNNACVSVALDQYDTAMDLLEVAERVGYESLHEHDLDDDEIKKELAHIFAQKAYVALKLGNDQEALEGNLAVLKNVSNDDITLAIASNNLVACRGNAQAFDSMKRFEKLAKKGEVKAGQSGKIARRNSLGEGGLELAAEFAEGLTEPEGLSVMCNYAIVSLLGNRFDAVEKTAKNMRKKKPDLVSAAVLQAMALMKKKEGEEALDLLDDFASKYEDSFVEVQLAKCELAASSGKWKLASQALASTPEQVRYQPAALATLVHLLGKCSDHQQAGDIIDSATKWWESSMLGGQEESEMDKYVKVMKIAGQFKFEQRQLDAAAKLYEKILEKTDNPLLRSEAMAGLVQLHGVDDSSLADKYEAEMPPIPGIDEIDVEILEQTTMKASRPTKEATGAGAQKDTSTAAASVPSIMQDVYAPKTKAQRKREFLKTLPAERQEYVLERQKAQRKEKAKKKMKLPAGYDPNKKPDPERWIAKRDRTNYKKSRREKRKDKNVVKGSQGAGKVDERLDKSSGPVESKPPNVPSRAGRRKGKK